MYTVKYSSLILLELDDVGDGEFTSATKSDGNSNCLTNLPRSSLSRLIHPNKIFFFDEF